MVDLGGQDFRTTSHTRSWTVCGSTGFTKKSAAPRSTLERTSFSLASVVMRITGSSAVSLSS